MDPLSHLRDTPIPIIKNEELILLRAEANIGLGEPGRGAARHQSRAAAGRAICRRSATLGTPDAAITELLYNRLYSLMFEGGHRWIDARRYGRLNTTLVPAPVDRPDRPDLLHSSDPHGRDEPKAIDPNRWIAMAP